MKTSLGDTTIATFYVETEPNELGMVAPHTFEVEVNLRGFGALYRRALRSLQRQATESMGDREGKGKAIVVRVVK